MDDVARPLGLSLEHAMYTNLCGGSGEPNEQYKSQLRTILFNVKKNPSLRDRLLVGSLSTATLSTMSTQAMASEEQQQKDAEIKREAEKQHIIVEENRPRIRRTHKGEEIVEGDTHAGVSESIFSSTIARRAAFEAENQSPDPGASVAGRSVSPKTQQRPEHGEGKVSQGPEANGDAGRPHSPSAAAHDAEFPEVPEHLHQQLPPESKAQADEEIDNLLKEEEPESPPYSPKDIDSGGIVWQGKISMHPVAEFRSTARHVGGADLSGRIPWHQMIPPILHVDGRIEIQLATNYLCGLRFSNTTDVTVVSVSAPDDPSERAEFDKLFNYFTDRKRYGVVGKHPLSNVKDTYIIPIEAGVSKKPEFIELLENNSIEDPTTDRILLVVFVVKAIDFSSVTPSSQQPTPLHHTSQESHHPATTAAVASPLSSGTPLTQQNHHPTPTTPAMQPWTPSSPPPNYGVGAQFPPHQQPGFNTTYSPPPPPPQPSQQQPQPAQQQQPQQQQQQQQQLPSQQQSPPPPPSLVGITAALHVLGPQAQAPAIAELLKKVPDVNVPQLNLVRDIITRNPAAANDYSVLTQAIQQLTAGAGNGQSR